MPIATFSTVMSRSCWRCPRLSVGCTSEVSASTSQAGQYLPVAREERVGQRAVTPEHAVPVQLHHQTRHRVEQSRPVLGLIGRQPHEQPPVLPRPLEVTGHQDCGVELGLQHHARRDALRAAPSPRACAARRTPWPRSARACPSPPTAHRRPRRTSPGDGWARRRCPAGGHRGRSTPTAAGPTAARAGPQTLVPEPELRCAHCQFRRSPVCGLEQVHRAFGVLAQPHRVGQLRRATRVAPRHQLDVPNPRGCRRMPRCRGPRPGRRRPRRHRRRRSRAARAGCRR